MPSIRLYSYCILATAPTRPTGCPRVDFVGRRRTTEIKYKTSTASDVHVDGLCPPGNMFFRLRGNTLFRLRADTTAIMLFLAKRRGSIIVHPHGSCTLTIAQGQNPRCNFVEAHILPKICSLNLFTGLRCELDYDVNSVQCRMQLYCARPSALRTSICCPVRSVVEVLRPQSVRRLRIVGVCCCCPRGVVPVRERSTIHVELVRHYLLTNRKTGGG